MLAYAPRPERRRASPTTLALIVGGHAVVIGLVMTAKMDLPEDIKEPPIIVETIEVPAPPQPVDEPEPRRPVPNSQIDTPPVIIPTPPAPGPVVIPIPNPAPNPGPTIGSGAEPAPTVPIAPPIASTGPRFRTPESAIRPPYPPGKRELDEEATLRLKLSIDARGRVTAVEPVGRADQAFLEAARRHILRAWRYEPATQGGKAIASSTVITLKFELN